jgi:branched-chain amino acid transport system substrate-binding protein
MAKMRAMPINDFMTHNGQLRIDGTVLREMYLLQAKKPAESHGAWDLLKIIETIQGKEAFHPLAGEGCGLA